MRVVMACDMTMTRDLSCVVCYVALRCDLWYVLHT